MKEAFRVFVVDDEKIVLSRLKRVLTKMGLAVELFESPRAALEAMKARPPHLVITDVRMPGMDGLELLQRIKSSSEITEVIVMTGYASLEAAVEATKKGAFHYLDKPFELEQLKFIVGKALERVRLVMENARLKSALGERRRFREIVGESAAMREIFDTIDKVAKVDCNVIIQGESGTGKELIARALHHGSTRAGGPFVPFNCASFTEELMANELFGHERGAFTGAHEMKPGILESADKGTIFLDEFADMSQSMQVRLLRFLQEHTLLRVGGVREISVDARVIAATNMDIKELVESGKVRSDLYFRLNVVFIDVPPLRRRKEDIPLLILHFVNKYNGIFGKSVKGTDAGFLNILMGYSFPGNVRELENIMERAIALTEGDELTIRDLPSDFSMLSVTARPSEGLLSLREHEEDYIRAVYTYTGNNKQRTAELLGISRTTLWRKLKEMGLSEKGTR